MAATPLVLSPQQLVLLHDDKETGVRENAVGVSDGLSHPLGTAVFLPGSWILHLLTSNPLLWPTAPIALLFQGLSAV